MHVYSFIFQHTHTHRFIELPPHWLQHDDVTSHMIGCKAAEGRRGDAVKRERGRGKKKKERDGVRENAGTSVGGGFLLRGVSDVCAFASQH